MLRHNRRIHGDTAQRGQKGRIPLHHLSEVSALVLHTAAYWLLLSVRDAIPSAQTLATAEFTTLRMRRRSAEVRHRWRG